MILPSWLCRLCGGELREESRVFRCLRPDCGAVWAAEIGTLERGPTRFAGQRVPGVSPLRFEPTDPAGRLEDR